MNTKREKQIASLVVSLREKIASGALYLRPNDIAPKVLKVTKTNYRGKSLSKRSKRVSRDTGLAQEALIRLEHEGLVYRLRAAEHGSKVGEGSDEIWVVRRKNN